jgi:acyl carrier protein
MTLTTSITGEKIFNAVADSISSVTKINKTNINENTDLNKLNPEIDSLSRIEILMEVEKKMMDMTGLSKFSLDEGIL